jgi:SAM-dependent methyltransferase
MVNPGSGESRMDDADQRMRKLIRAFRSGEGTLSKVLKHQKQDAKNWGRGRFVPFYSSGLALRFEEIAFANAAWCSTRGNKHPPAMIDKCFRRHTKELLRILRPDIVLLSGTATYRLRTRIQNVLPDVETISMLHFAHRKGRSVWTRQAFRVRRQISSYRRTIKGVL